jgi:ubiquinone/menaquinone biosynthesis C-methylase UbiE
VHAFDLVAVNARVTACDMSNVPLADATLDVALFCLSLMGTNCLDFLREAARTLKVGGELRVAEVKSRFVDAAAAAANATSGGGGGGGGGDNDGKGGGGGKGKKGVNASAYASFIGTVNGLGFKLKRRGT